METETLASNETDRRFQLLLDTVPSGIIMVNAEGRIVMNNSEIEKMFGYSNGELIGQTVETLVPTRFKPRHQTYRHDYTEHPSKRQMGAGRDLKGLHKQGWEFPVEIGLNHLSSAGKTYVIATIVDITERKKTETRLKKVYSEVQQKNEEMEQFVYSISHDLKSPLVTSMSFLGFIKEDIAAGHLDEVPDSLDRLARAHKKMQELIDDLLELSRIGRVEPKLETISINELLDDIVDFISEEAKKRNVTIEVEPNLPSITGDRKRIYQVFENLLMNAIKYASSVPDPLIRVFARETSDEILFCVKDNGPGIEKQYHKKIFGLFQRLQSEGEGTGVGLAIVARAMQLHNGRAWVESEPGQGCEFWLAFPK